MITGFSGIYEKWMHLIDNRESYRKKKTESRKDTIKFEREMR